MTTASKKTKKTNHRGMNGQWIGRYSGTNSGLIMIDADDMGSHYQGRAYVYDDNPVMPSSFVFFTTTDKSNTFKLTLKTYPIDPKTQEPTTWEQLSGSFPGVIFPTSVEIDWKWDNKKIKLSWITNIRTHGAAEIPRTQADQASEYIPVSEVKTWDDFKKYAGSLEHRRFIFRGQTSPWRLRTNFHRTGRADLARFIHDDIKTLHRNLSSRTRHIFNLSIADENGAFFNLVQHHGYPTPLLDWTFSPFVAAFFAYSKLSKGAIEDKGHKVRIFLFDHKSWREKFLQFNKLTPLRPHFSILEFIAIDNERMIPQQALSAVSNIDDIETYIRRTEMDDIRYLKVIDLPANERKIVMRELSTMGITAGSLFPGIDGACEELRERFFNL